MDPDAALSSLLTKTTKMRKKHICLTMVKTRSEDTKGHIYTQDNEELNKKQVYNNQ